MGKILAICISEKKGTQKKPIESARLVEEWGIEGDAHVGKMAPSGEYAFI